MVRMEKLNMEVIQKILKILFDHNYMKKIYLELIIKKFLGKQDSKEMRIIF